MIVSKCFDFCPLQYYFSWSFVIGFLLSTAPAANEFVDLTMAAMASIAAKGRVPKSAGISASCLPRLLLAESHSIGHGGAIHAGWQVSGNDGGNSGFKLERLKVERKGQTER